MYVQYPESEEKPKERGALFYFGIVAVIIFAGIISFNSFSSVDWGQQQQTDIVANKKFYTKIASNIRKCDSLSCDVIGKASANTEWELPYQNTTDLPEWIYITYTDGNGKEIIGYINKVNLEIEKTDNTQSQTQQAEIDALKNQLNALQNAPPKPAPVSDDLSVIIAEWKNRVAQVKCTWNYTNGTSFKLDGSATLVNFAGQGTTAITNKHVLLDINGHTPNYCVIGIYGGGGRIVTMDAPANPFGFGSSEDYGYIYLSSQYQLNNGTSATDGGTFDTVVANRFNVCASEPSIGDKIIVLGYPAIGTSGGITATEGIISGIESDYYVTSAKIDHGNSGGAAISVKNDCYLGIPTWAQSGSIESLGRILKASFAVEQ